MSSRRALSWETAASLVVLLIMRPSGSFHDAFLLEPSCFISMCEALISPPTFDDDIFTFFFRFSFSDRSAAEVDAFFLFRSDSIFAAPVTLTPETEPNYANWTLHASRSGIYRVVLKQGSLVFVDIWDVRLRSIVRVRFIIASLLIKNQYPNTVCAACLHLIGLCYCLMVIMLFFSVGTNTSKCNGQFQRHLQLFPSICTHKSIVNCRAVSSCYFIYLFCNKKTKLIYYLLFIYYIL